jgi:putative ABC transport system permease protein
VLIILLSLRGRSHELGILLAVGEKRLKIIGQIFIETLIPVAVAFLIAVWLNGAVSQKIGQSLLTKEVNASHSESATMARTMSAFSIGNVMITDPNANPEGKISVAVSPADLYLLALSGLVLLLISVAASSALILRFNPRTILVKRE